LKTESSPNVTPYVHSDNKFHSVKKNDYTAHEKIYEKISKTCEPIDDSHYVFEDRQNIDFKINQVPLIYWIYWIYRIYRLYWIYRLRIYNNNWLYWNNKYFNSLWY
jgi:hypothetical protein